MPGAVGPPPRRSTRQWGSATPRLTQARRTARSTDLQFVPVLTSLHRRRPCVLSPRPSSPSASGGGHPFADLHGGSPGAPFRPLALRALVRPAVSSERASL